MTGPFAIASRASAGLPPSRADVDSHAKTAGFVHYSGDFGRRLWTFNAAATRVRGYYNFHTGPQRGWADIGYSYLVFQPWYRLRPLIFQGRPRDRIPAAQQGYNSGSIAVCIVAGPGEHCLGRTEDAVAWLFRQFPSIRTIGAHRDVNSTDCPGSQIYAHISAIAAKAGKQRR